MKRSVFFLSDRTGITAETLGRSLLTQFEGVEFVQTTWPFLDNREKAEHAVERIDQAAVQDGARPLVFSTLINSGLLEIIRRSNGLVIDFFDTYTGILESELSVRASHVSGRSHGMGNYANYALRIDALNFALSNDDGVLTGNYAAADIILVGVSRSGKTPTCLYLALQHGVLAANYPITEEDFQSPRLPEPLRPHHRKLFGLSINPDRLHQIRTERRPDSRYADLGQCQFEVERVEGLFRREGIRFLNTTNMSIEEIATTILQQTALKRRLHN